MYDLLDDLDKDVVMLQMEMGLEGLSPSKLVSMRRNGSGKLRGEGDETREDDSSLGFGDDDDNYDVDADADADDRYL